MLKASYIETQLTLTNILFILQTLGADYNFINEKEVHFKSICHNSNSYKLYYYINTHLFYCHRDSKKWNIFSLISDIKNISYYDAVTYVQTLCKIKSNDISELDDWQSMKKFLPIIDKKEIQMKKWDKTILKNFDTYYCDKWLNEGISVETMAKYNILWCSRNASIIIPCYDENNFLIGIRQRFLRDSDKQSGKYKPYTHLNGEQYNFSTGLNLYGLNHNLNNIKNIKKCLIVEGEKSVLQLDSFLKNNISVAVYGSNVSNYQRTKILSLGVNEIIIGVDFDYTTINTDEFCLYKKKVLKIKKMFCNYCTVSVLCSIKGHRKKDSPSDNGKNFFLNLYKNRIFLN